MVTHVGDVLVVGGLLGKRLLRALSDTLLSTLQNHHGEVLAHVYLAVSLLKLLKLTGSELWHGCCVRNHECRKEATCTKPHVCLVSRKCNISKPLLLVAFAESYRSALSIARESKLDVPHGPSFSAKVRTAQASLSH